jgi:hypothetical protein
MTLVSDREHNLIPPFKMKSASVKPKCRLVQGNPQI